jgi:DnaJ domain
MSSYTDDPYAELGVAVNADLAAIKKAYRQLALLHHPDRAGGDTAKFARIAAAYEILTDEYLRAEYNRSRRNVSEAEEATAATAAGSTKKENKNKKKQNRDETPPPVFRYHFSDPYEVWKRDFKDQYGVEYPGAQYDWVSHDDRLTNDRIDRSVVNNNHPQAPLLLATNGTAPPATPTAATGPSVAAASVVETAPPSKQRGGGGFVARLFRRQPKAETGPGNGSVPASGSDKSSSKSSHTALVPFSKTTPSSSTSSSALVPFSAGTTAALLATTKTNGAATSTMIGRHSNNKDGGALVATTGRNNRPISMDVQTTKEGRVTTTTTTLVRPDGSTETITMRTGLAGPAPNNNNKLAITNGDSAPAQKALLPPPAKMMMIQDQQKKKMTIVAADQQNKLLSIADDSVGTKKKKNKTPKDKTQSPKHAIENGGGPTSRALVAID